MRDLLEHEDDTWLDFCRAVKELLPVAQRFSEEQYTDPAYEMALLGRRALTAVNNGILEGEGAAYAVRLMFSRDDVVEVFNVEEVEDPDADTVGSWGAIWRLASRYATTVHGKKVLGYHELKGGARNSRGNLYRNASGTMTYNHDYIVDGYSWTLSVTIKRL
jgi:hypothetical protein